MSAFVLHDEQWHEGVLNLFCNFTTFCRDFIRLYTVIGVAAVNAVSAVNNSKTQVVCKVLLVVQYLFVQVLQSFSSRQ